MRHVAPSFSRAPALTPRAQAARDRNLPILTEAWVHACAARGQPLDVDDSSPFLLPPFAGLFICVTGVDVGAWHARCCAGAAGRCELSRAETARRAPGHQGGRRAERGRLPCGAHQSEVHAPGRRVCRQRQVPARAAVAQHQDREPSVVPAVHRCQTCALPCLHLLRPRRRLACAVCLAEASFPVSDPSGGAAVGVFACYLNKQQRLTLPLRCRRTATARQVRKQRFCEARARRC